MLKNWLAQLTEPAYPYAFTKHAVGRLMALLYIAAGAFTCLSSWIDAETRMDAAVILGVGMAAALIGGISWIVPWRRMPRWVPVVVMVPITDTLICVHNAFAHDPYRYALYFIVSYVWIGLTQRQGVGLLLLPFSALAYLLPLLHRHDMVGLYSAYYMLPMLAVVGESLAWLGYRLGEARERLTYMAYHDSLTGLFNRAYFYRLADELTKASSEGGALSMVMLIDLNDFKSVNDQYGHGVGDTLLQLTASVLDASTVGHGVWARLGGDEFGCIVQELANERAADYFTEMVQRALEIPIAVNDMSFRVGASIGLALIPGHAMTVEEALAHADALLYADKKTVTVDTHVVVYV